MATMRREIHFYFLVTGLTIQILMMVYYYLVIFPATLSHTLADGQPGMFILLLLLTTPISAILMSIGNKGYRICPTWLLNLVTFSPIPLTMIGLAIRG
jgi:hypothetical protein